MLHKTRGIVLRCTKYGETSLIVSIFTEKLGLHSYMVKGVRSGQRKQQKAGLFQTGNILDMVVEHKQDHQLHFIREYNIHYFYRQLQEDMLKNSITIFSVEVLQKLLPQGEVMEDLFEFACDYFQRIDKNPAKSTSNYPLYFLMVCGRKLGYGVSGTYSEQTPYLDYRAGIFCREPQHHDLILEQEECKTIHDLQQCGDIDTIAQWPLHTQQRSRMIDWYILFLKSHTQHFGHLKSLDILKVILH